MVITSAGEWDEEENEIVMEILYPDLMEEKRQKEIDESVQSLTNTLNNISDQAEIVTNQLHTYNESVKVKKKGFFSSLFEFIGIYSMFKFLFGKKKTKTPNRYNNRKCNGDCKNCPPHYGYRYGRWYYGHHHNGGCEFGGNNGL